MKKITNRNNVTNKTAFDMIPEEYRFEGYQRWMDYARYDWLENPKCEEWDNLIEEEVNGCVPLTFMLCVSVAGMISGALEEESIKVHMQNDLQERTAGFFAVACGGKTKETEGQKGHTYMVDKVLTLPEIVDEEGHLKLHEAIIAVSHEGKRNKTYDLPTAWLDIAPDVRWIKGRDSGVRILDFYHGVGGHSIPSIKRVFNIWGEEKLRRVLDCEIKKFKRCAKKRGKYREMPEEFFKQIGMILTAYNVVEERYGLHTGKKKLVDFIFRNVTVLWHDPKVEYANEYRRITMEGEYDYE